MHSRYPLRFVFQFPWSFRNILCIFVTWVGFLSLAVSSAWWRSKSPRHNAAERLVLLRSLRFWVIHWWIYLHFQNKWVSEWVVLLYFIVLIVYQLEMALEMRWIQITISYHSVVGVDKNPFVIYQNAFGKTDWFLGVLWYVSHVSVFFSICSCIDLRISQISLGSF